MTPKKNTALRYCASIHQTRRFKTRQVMVGNIGVGGSNPIRIQSMTTSNTRDVESTIEQVIRLADAGCEIARLTVQGIKEADACEAIKNGLLQRGYTIPLVADIHFFPPAAIRVVDFVDKVRINPGNYVDKRALFKTISYDDASYVKEIEKIEEKFSPLVEKCKRLKRSMRIGTNHGSLSDRIMNRYGDSPKGMVESALEFARVCRRLDYHDFVFSMKSSNPQVMILAYRLLVAEMIRLGWDYPLHLGVTEAGEGEDGRIKSAMGIGSLVLDGIGDTVRVSLTEDPWNEIDPCKRLIRFAESYQGQGVDPFLEKHRVIQAIKRRSVSLPKDTAFHRDGTVFLTARSLDMESSDFYQQIGCEVTLRQPKLTRCSADCIVLAEKSLSPRGELVVQALQQVGISVLSNDLVTIQNEPPDSWGVLLASKPPLIILSPSHDKLHYARQFFDWLQEHSIDIPVIIRFRYTCSKEDLIIQAAAEYGALFCDGLGEGIWIDGPYEIEFLRTLSFNILQAARMRTSKTEFISCPSCGRTLFDLQDVSKRIRSRTAHLPGVKIAIMGCIVNGPGEMADADFGYVGSKPGMIDLYVGKECVEKEISFADADDRLIALIQHHGRWVDPVS